MGIMAGGGETTLEDRIIYSEEFKPLIDEYLEKIKILVTTYESDFEDFELRALLESLTFKVVLAERGR